ncbi:MAG: SDR family oxidoreductase, partial [Bacteroidota bacterium]|nr:SDR family oxidoreductase [Bacteroidota bacterium]MDX5429512.1 SDR family oxidoreductase [Bacteroidota bacterium]MDX5468297.1 SDR family oxidoreductase [Bacteroidota bacterium]
MDTTRRRNIVVSGASKGIGRAIVRKFYEEGFDVAFCARDNKALNQFKNELEALNRDQKILAISCDVSDKEAVEWFAEQVVFEFEEVDVLVNNAGIFLPGQISTEEEGVFEKSIQTNLSSAYYLSRALIPSMKGSNHAHLFSMCSTASITAYPNGGSYCISKFALLGMTKVLREELKPDGIAVTAILPGATYTHSWSGSE